MARLASRARFAAALRIAAMNGRGLVSTPSRYSMLQARICIFLSLAVLLCAAAPARAMTGPRLPASEEELVQKLMRAPWTWEVNGKVVAQLKFLAKGRAVCRFGTKNHKWKWKPAGLMAVQIKNQKGKPITVRLNPAITEFSGVDHDGNPLKGRLLKPL